MHRETRTFSPKGALSCRARGRSIRSSRMPMPMHIGSGLVTVFRRHMVLPAVGVAVLLGAVASASAQDAAGKPYDEIRDVEPVSREEIRELNGAMREGRIPDRALFERYYTYRVAEFTWASNRKQLHALRDRLKKQDLQQATGTAYDALNAFLLERMEAIASNENFHPAVRLNAVLLLGNLDRTKPDFSGRGFVPLPEALAPLLSKARTDKATPVDDTLLVAALVGIRRHAAAERKVIGAKERTQIVETMLALVNAEKPAQRGADIDSWIRRRAAEVLSAMGMPGIDAGGTEVVRALQAMSANQKLSITSRCAAAEAIGHLDLARVSKDVDSKKWLRPLSLLSRDVMQEETSAGPVIFYLESVQTALLGRATREKRIGGLISIAEGDTKAELTSLSENVAKVIDQLENHGIDRPGLPDNFSDLLHDLEQSISTLIGPERTAVGEAAANRAETR